ncbi:MAG: DUF4340 domain-containing protein [Alphaproteobacteria bacterium]|nr:DUF4340 domain-containing protein [Alphaproteobacteria bacterium]
MKPTQKTLALAALAALLLVALAVGRLAPGDGGTLPRLPAVTGDQLQRIELSNAIDKLVLEPAPDATPEALAEGRGWRLTAPVQAPADARMVRGLLDAFDAPVTMDVRIDQGNESDYGLDAGKGIVVELWQDGGDPVISLTVGGPAPGGSNFVRPSGDETVYRAQVGGAERYPVQPGQWRDRVPLGFAGDDVVELTVHAEGGGDDWTIRREPGADGTPGQWTLDPPAPWLVDDAMLDVVVERLGALRAEEVLDASVGGGLDAPAAVATFTLADGSRRTLTVGSRLSRQAAFVRSDTGDAVYRVVPDALAPLFAGRDDLRDKTLMGFDVQDIDALGLDEAGASWRVRQVSGGSWQVVQPANAALDVGALALVARALSQLRGDFVAEGVDASAAGLGQPASVVRVFLVDGSELVLSIGAATTDPRGQPSYFVRVQGQREILLLRASTVQRIRAAFGRG